ncbi:MAG: tRNA1(Val) (adenine(37)-N6)-methyltransferase [Saprospiraceae bacterium]|nr:MAG: tRNA1(Val) (adenine(37)-N6)-methyltransferase [Saprospiraceae bacterium]
MQIGTDGVLLGAWTGVENANRILDIGTGTGIIAIILAQRSEGQIHAVEIHPESCQQAAENMQASPWTDRLTVFNESIQQFSRGKREIYDLIVSNPPFFTGGTFSNQQDRNNVRHTTKLPHGDLLTSARNLLSPEGRFCVILPFIEGLRFQELAATYHLYCTKMTEVTPRPGLNVNRLLLQFERTERPLVRDLLAIRQTDSEDWTDEYIAMTGAFYLKM